MFMRKMFAVSALLFCFLGVAVDFAAGANNLITGSVRNRSNNQPAAGDDVVLLRIDQGMQEETRTKTDTQGAFSLTVQHPDQPYLVQVIHANVGYDQRAFSGQTLFIEVFDAAPQVQGITGGIEILRTGTDGKLLHVSDMYEIRNESQPPMTQAGERTFDVYLPAKAKIDSVLAAGQGRMGIIISATPVADDPGHFTVNFPLRPGSNTFAFNYSVPYDGHVAFQTRREYPMQQFAVMIPPTMKFSSHSKDFQLLATGTSDYQVQAIHQVKAGNGPAFEVSGTGALPSLQVPKKPGQVQAQSSAPPNTKAFTAPTSSARAALPPVTRVDSSLGKSQSSSQLFVLGGISVALLVVCALLVWRTRARSKAKQQKVNSSTTANAANPPLLDALKEELFRLETDRLHGSISKEEYQATRQTLEAMVKRTVAKTGAL